MAALVCFLICGPHCRAQAALPSDLAAAAFDQLWGTFDSDYAMFVLRPEVDWTALRGEKRPLALASSTTNEFAGVCADMLRPLRDLHVWLTVSGVNVPVYDRPRLSNANPNAFASLLGSLSNSSPALQWAITADQIGFVVIYNWQDTTLPAQFDSALECMRNTRALIIDVRLNGGGNEALAGQVAARFLDREVIYAYSQYRNGPQHTNLTDKLPRTLEPRGPFRYDHPVLVLIGQRCMSSNESFIAMMTCAPQVVTMGDRTAGSSGNPEIIQLPLDMTVSVPRWIDYLPDGTVLDERGIFPNMPFAGSPDSFLGQRDDLLSGALYFLFNSNQAAPVILTQPTNQTLLSGSVASLSVAVLGFPRFGYTWFREGQALADGTASTCLISNIQPAQAGDYTVVVTNGFGAVTSVIAKVVVIPTVPLDFALNNSTFAWTTSATDPWYGQTEISHDAQAAARSYSVGNGQQSVLRTLTNGPGTLRFWWKNSDAPLAGQLSFSASGGGVINSLRLSGTVDWAQQIVCVPDGPVDLQWVYESGAATDEGGAGYLDQVTYSPGFTLPYIVAQPSGATIVAASPVTLPVTGGGTPPLSYQWRRNGVDLPDATASALTIPNFGPGDVGSYSVRIRNPYGEVVSQGAYLEILPLVVRGDDSFGQTDFSASATNLTMIAAGSWHSLALRPDGTVVAWGEDYNQQCDVPAGLLQVQTVAGGGYHSLALKSDGTITGWGANDYGQASPPAGLQGIRAIAAGAWHSLALRRNGTVVAWGDNSCGQTNVPSELSNIVAIAAGGSHNLALREDGKVVAWGNNLDPEGNFVGQAIAPWNLDHVRAIAAGEYHSLAVRSDGTIVTWGDNSQGQCQVPPGLSNVVAAAGGGGHSVALLADGTVTAWGNNWNGQCTLPQGLSNVIAVAAGDAHTLLLIEPSVEAAQLLCPVWQTNCFTVWLRTQPARSYTLEFTASLPATNWTPVSSITGAGLFERLSDPTASTPRRFYRVRVK